MARLICKNLACVAAFMAILPMTANAYSVFPFNGGTEFLKWGDSNMPATPGGVVTWSFIPAGTAGDAGYCGTACPGTSVSSINIENSPGTGYTLTPLTSLESVITAAMDKWAAVADLTFVKLGSDSGVAVNDPAAVPNATGQIRIGAFNFSAGGGAVGFAPPPNGGTGAGDILFDANSFYAFQPGNEGDAFPGASTAPNDIESLFLHELGHAIGLAHPNFDGTCPVMQIDSSCLGIINRELDADDIAGAQFLYGPAAVVPLPAAAWLFGSGLIGLGAVARHRRPV